MTVFLWVLVAIIIAIVVVSIVLIIVVAVNGSSSGNGPLNQPPVPKSGYALIQLVNSSGQPDSSVYILIKGQDASANQHYLQISRNGIGSFVTLSNKTMSASYSYKFSSLPYYNSTKYVYIPQPFISGRIYFSLNQPLILALGVDSTTGKTTIEDPSPFALNDVNYYTLYDKVELTVTTASDNNQGLIKPFFFSKKIRS